MSQTGFLAAFQFQFRLLVCVCHCRRLCEASGWKAGGVQCQPVSGLSFPRVSPRLFWMRDARGQFGKNMTTPFREAARYLRRCWYRYCAPGCVTP